MWILSDITTKYFCDSPDKPMYKTDAPKYARIASTSQKKSAYFNK